MSPPNFEFLCLRFLTPQLSELQYHHTQFANQENMVLRNINLSVPRGKLTVILGPCACGKSSLLQTMLGQSQFNYFPHYMDSHSL